MALSIKHLALVCAATVMSVVICTAQAPSPRPSPGPRVGAAAPSFTGVDQLGRTHTLQSLIDRNGLMLVFFRSADW